MDDQLGREVVAFGDLSFAGRAAAQSAAFLQELWSGRMVDRAINASAAQKRSVGRVDDGIDVLLGDIAFDDGYSVEHLLPC